MRLPVLLRYLVFVLPLLVVSFAVLMAAAAIAQMAGDPVAQWVMHSAAAALLVAIAVDAILLIGVLGLKALIDHERQQQWQRMGKHRRRRHRGRRRERKGGRRRGPEGRPAEGRPSDDEL